MTDQDLIVIGAGPAGMAAAQLAASHGAAVTIIDEQPGPGGQIYRNLSGATPSQRRVLGADYLAGQSLIKNMQAAPVTHLPECTVWDVTSDGTVTYSRDGKAASVNGQHVLIATGALERPTPVPGWTLPGVMTAGAAQILIKSSGLVPRDAVLAGSGPLLYLVAAQMAAAGHPPKALVETQGRVAQFRALRHLGGVLRGWKALVKGLGLIATLRKAGVRRYTGATDLAVTGQDYATGLSFAAGGARHHLNCDTVLLHQGVVPNTQITRALGLDHVWSDQQRCFVPVRDRSGQTSNPRFYVAGDGGGIAGANAAACSGKIAAADILHRQGRINAQTRDDLIVSPARKRACEQAIRPFLDTLYAPPDEILRPGDPVIICRCEEVTAGDIRNYARLGCAGPNQTKAFGRSGMGPCQGRYCGLTVTELLAQSTGQSPHDVGSYRIRAPLKPVTLGEVAALATTPEQGDPT